MTNDLRLFLKRGERNEAAIFQLGRKRFFLRMYLGHQRIYFQPRSQGLSLETRLNYVTV